MDREGRQWREICVRNMKVWKSGERRGKGIGERDWLGNGAQSGMYYTCSIWIRLKNSVEASNPKILIYEEK